MGFGFAGAAAGAARSLEEIVAQRILAEKLREEVDNRQQRLELERSALNQRSVEHADQVRGQQRDDDRLDADRRDRNNARGLDLMKDDRAAMDLDAAVSGLPAHLKPLGPLMKVGGVGKIGAEDLEDPAAKAKRLAAEREQAINDQIRIRNATREPKTPEQVFVKRGDQVIPIPKGTAIPGDIPYDHVAARSGKPDNERALDAMRAYGDDMLAVIDTLIDEDGNLKPDAAGVIGGLEGLRPEWAYGSEGSQGALANIDRLQSMLNINTLRDMKSQSRTGATGFGALSERELNVVESSASKLRRRRQGDADYAAELKRVRDAIRVGRQAAPASAGGDEIDQLIEKLRKPKG